MDLLTNLVYLNFNKLTFFGSVRSVLAAESH